MTGTTQCQEPLFEIMSLEGKKCQNSVYDWHKYPKTRLKDNPFPDTKPTRQTFMVATRGEDPQVGIFCYHCFLSFLGKCIIDWRKAGATEKEIHSWIPAPYYPSSTSGDSR